MRRRKPKEHQPGLQHCFNRSLAGGLVHQRQRRQSLYPALAMDAHARMSAREVSRWRAGLEEARADPIAGLVPCAEPGTSNVRTAAIRAILSRKSVSPRHLKDPGPNEAEIHLMLHAALAAPDHGNLRPWRTVLIPQSRRNQLASRLQNWKKTQTRRKMTSIGQAQRPSTRQPFWSSLLTRFRATPK